MATSSSGCVPDGLLPAGISLGPPAAPSSHSSLLSCFAFCTKIMQQLCLTFQLRVLYSSDLLLLKQFFFNHVSCFILSQRLSRVSVYPKPAGFSSAATDILQSLWQYAPRLSPPSVNNKTRSQIDGKITSVTWQAYLKF